eukprot:10848681-Karenia_brevis.AAC.1
MLKRLDGIPKIPTLGGRDQKCFERHAVVRKQLQDLVLIDITPRAYLSVSNVAVRRCPWFIDQLIKR